MRFLMCGLLPAVVFITGAVVLIIEVVAVRVLSPYYGSTIYTVSSVISVILLALSAGYYAGGKLADRKPSFFLFFSLILFSGLLLLLCDFLGAAALPAFSPSLPFIYGPLIFSGLIFLLPALLLGTLSPFAVKLQQLQNPAAGIGTIAGQIFFWSTFGSITGSLLAGFVLIPRFGVGKIVIYNGFALFLLGLIPLIFLGIKRKQVIRLMFIFLFLLLLTWSAVKNINAQALYYKDGVYEKLYIYDGYYNGRPVRFFQQDRSLSAAMYLDTEDQTDMVYEYSKYYKLYKIFKPDIKKALVIGGGAYSIPKALLQELPAAEVAVCEIEPSLFGLSKKFFRLKESDHLENHTADGRRFLLKTTDKYDLIFGDAYHSLYSLPAHLTTREFFFLAKEKLNDGGVFMANIIGDMSLEKYSLVMSEIKTFKEAFDNSYFFAVNSPAFKGVQNFIFVGLNSGKKINLTNQNDNLPDWFKDNFSRKQIHTEKIDLSLYPVLTDDYAPVEFMTVDVLKRNLNSLNY